MIGAAMDGYTLGAAAERLTLRLRDQVFRNLINQDASYYDAPANSRGILTSRLATDPKDARQFFHGPIKTYSKGLAMIGVGCGLAFALCPQMGGLMLAFTPFTAFSCRFVGLCVGGDDSKSHYSLFLAPSCDTCQVGRWLAKW